MNEDKKNREQDIVSWFKGGVTWVTLFIVFNVTLSYIIMLGWNYGINKFTVLTMPVTLVDVMVAIIGISSIRSMIK
jgi:hypothetical protein